MRKIVMGRRISLCFFRWAYGQGQGVFHNLDTPDEEVGYIFIQIWRWRLSVTWQRT